MNKVVESVDNIVTGDIQSYFKFRKLVEPTALQAFLWLLTEMGEVATLLLYDARNGPEGAVLENMIYTANHAELVLMEHSKNWVRNNPNEKKKEAVDKEIGDCLMMLYKFAEKSKVNPFTSLVTKMETKGWNGERAWVEQEGVKSE